MYEFNQLLTEYLVEIRDSRNLLSNYLFSLFMVYID